MGRRAPQWASLRQSPCYFACYLRSMPSAAEWNLPETFMFEGRAVRFGTQGTGRPLVLVHGTPFSSIVWRNIAPRLSGKRQVFYFDLLGYGRSEMRAGQDVSL